MSGLRRPGSPPWHARLSERRFRRWTRKVTQSDRLAAFGEDSIIYAPALIVGHQLIRIGSDVVIHPGAFLSVVGEHEGVHYDASLVIGDGVRIGHDIHIACCGSIGIGDDVLTADRVFIGDTYHQYRDVSRPVRHQGLGDPRPVSIGAGAFLGINCSVLPGVTVGEGACVGANAVVTGDVPAHSLAVGNPARVIRRWDGVEWVDVSSSR